jgi:hypothetical protein
MVDEYVVVAWAERCEGPGWSNSIVWYIAQLPSGKLVQRSLQPEEQTTSMHCLFDVSNVTTVTMTDMVRKLVGSGKGEECPGSSR